MAYVYQHIRLDTDEVFYIGIGSDTEGKYSRANKKEGRNARWVNVVNKVGYRVEIIKDSISWEEACKEEVRLIKFFGRENFNEGKLVNQTNGGDGTYGLIQSRELLDRLSNMNKGDKNPNWGKKHTKEARDKMGVNKGQKFPIDEIERNRRLLIKNANKRINELSDIELELAYWLDRVRDEIGENEQVVQLNKKERIKRYDRVKLKQQIEHQ